MVVRGSYEILVMGPHRLFHRYSPFTIADEADPVLISTEETLLTESPIME